MNPRIFLILPLMVAGAWAAVPTTLPDAWQTLANYRPDQALPQFEQLAAQKPVDPRQAKWGIALSLLAQPSAVPDRVGKAQTILTGLAADGSDDLALGARFFLARLAEFQLDPTDPRLAAKEFRRLIAEHPDSVWAQAAVARLALLLLYTPAGPPAPSARIAAAEQLMASAHQPQAITELHLVIADAIFHYRMPDAAALPHLLAAEKTGALDAITRGDVLVQIGELSRLGGQPEQAARYYQMFLAEYPRDARQFAIRQQRALVERKTTAP